MGDPDLLTTEGERSALEIEKLASETKLLKLTIRRFQRPWLDPETVFKAVALPISIVSLAASFYVTDLKSSLDEMNKEKHSLETEVHQLATTKFDLEAKNRSLEQTSRTYRDKLSDEQFKTTLGLLQKDSSSFASPPTLPVLIPELTKVLVRQDVSHRSQQASVLAHLLDNERRPRVRASLLIVLYKATGDSTWREKIKDEFLETLNAPFEPGTIMTGLFPDRMEARLLLITEVSTWGERERVRLSIELLESARLRPHPSQYLLFDTFRLACHDMWREDLNVGRVTADNVSLVLACIGNARNFSLDRSVQWGPRVQSLLDLRDLSEEAFTATVATILSDPNTDRDTRFRMDTSVIGLLPERLSDDVDVPRTASDAQIWKTWVENNSELMELYMDPKLNHLRIKLKQDHHIPL